MGEEAKERVGVELARGQGFLSSRWSPFLLGEMQSTTGTPRRWVEDIQEGSLVKLVVHSLS